jgi:hypothetical protein
MSTERKKMILKQKFNIPAAAACFRASKLNFDDGDGRVSLAPGADVTVVMALAVALSFSVNVTSATSRVFSLIFSSCRTKENMKINNMLVNIWHRKLQ